MDQPAPYRRDVSHCQFGDNTVIHQGDTHWHLPHQPGRTAAVRVIPYPRNEDLVSRPSLVNKLDALLPRTSTFCSAALWGLGGSGKTQIALDYAHRRCDDPGCSVFWVHADSEATFIHDYKTIAKKFGVDRNLDGEDLLDAVLSSIEAQPQWVLILDNADDLTLFSVGQATNQTENSLLRYIPRTSVGTILWTSRDAHIAGTLVGSKRGIEVARMSSDEARELLSTARGEESSERSGGEETETATLLEELQWFPLAISQAGAYMRRTSMTVNEYLYLLVQGKQRWDVLKASEFDRHRRPDVPNSVLETWRISIERIRQESKMAYGILHVIAYLDSQSLPHEMMTVAVSKFSDEDMTGQPGDLEVLRAISRLREFSFLSVRRMDDGDRSYEMHKLVQEATRYGLSVRDSTEEVSESYGPGMRSSGESDLYYSSVALEVVADLFPVSSQESWTQCEKYVAHAVRVGAWAELCEKQIEMSALLSRVSDFLFDRGRWWEKEPVDQRGLGLRREVLGEKHPDTISSMANLAATYHTQGRYDEAERLRKQALGLRREILGEKHPDTIWSMADLAATYHAQGRYDEDEEISVKVLDLRQEILREEHPDTIRSMADLAVTYHEQDRYDEAERLKNQALGLRREILGEKHPDTISSMASLAATYHAQGRYDEAEKIYMKALDLRQEVLGEKHPDTISSMASLAATYHAQDRYEEDEEISVKVLDLRQEVLGEKHPDTLQAMHDLAITWNSLGHRQNALGLMQQCLRSKRSVLGPDHPLTEMSTQALGRWKQKLRREY